MVQTKQTRYDADGNPLSTIVTGGITVDYEYDTIQSKL